MLTTFLQKRIFQKQKPTNKIPSNKLKKLSKRNYTTFIQDIIGGSLTDAGIYNRDGTFANETLSTSQFMTKYSLSVRELRQVLDVKNVGTSIIIKQECIAFKIGFFRGVVDSNSLVLVDTVSNAKLRSFNTVLAKYLEVEKFDREREFFEFHALDAILDTVCEIYTDRLAVLMPVIAKVISTIEEEYDEGGMQRLFPVSKCLTNFDFELEQFLRGLDKLMNEEDRFIKYTPVFAPTQSQVQPDLEMSIVFSEFTAKIQEMRSEIEKVEEHIVSMTKGMEIELDMTRNQLMTLNLQISMFTMVLGMGALVGGLFGMNLESGLENHPTMFYHVIAVLISTLSAVYAGINMYYLAKRSNSRRISRIAANHPFFNAVNNPEYVENIKNVPTNDLYNLREEKSKLRELVKYHNQNRNKSPKGPDAPNLKN